MTTLQAISIDRIRTIAPDVVPFVITHRSEVLALSASEGQHFARYDLLVQGIAEKTVDSLFTDPEVKPLPAFDVDVRLSRSANLACTFARALDDAGHLRDAVLAHVQRDGGASEHEGQGLDVRHETSSCDARSRCNAPGLHVTVEGPADVSPVPSVIDVAVDGYAWRAALARDVERETRR